MNAKRKIYPLPKGATLFKRIQTLKVGHWNQMTYDAWFRRFGVRWLRVHKGMGNQSGWSRSDHPADDWVADIRGACVSVHSYNWHKEFLGPNYGSFNAALKGQLADGLQTSQRRKGEILEKLGDANAAISHLKLALAKAAP